MYSSTNINIVKPTAPQADVEQKDSLSSYFEFFEMNGYSPDVADIVLTAMKASRPNGFGVLSGSGLEAQTGYKADAFMPACYGLFSDGVIDRLIVHDDHIVFAIQCNLTAEVRAIQSQSQSNDEWLAAYDAAPEYQG